MPVPLPASRRAVLAPLAVLVSSLLLTGAITGFFVVTARERDSSRFEGLVHQTRDRIAAHLDSDVTLLRGAAGLFAASTEVTAEEFRIYVERLRLARHEPGIQSIGFSRRVGPDEQADGQEHHAILHLEPRSPDNPGALGDDMFEEPVRRVAMERAWRTGEAALSGKVLLPR
ncbi:MAG TPA: CHASE domain-containing protein, partial [Myxococcaceae bacterium]